MKCSFLRLLLNSAIRGCSRNAVQGLGTAAPTFLFGRTLIVVTAIVVVVVNFHLSSCGLVHRCGLRWRRTLLFFPRSRRHAWRRGLVDGLHRRQRLRRGWCRWVVRGLGWVISRGRSLFVHPPHFGGTAIRRGGYLERLRRLTLQLYLIKPCACLISRRPLDALVLFPFPDALGSSAARPLISFARSGIGCILRVRRRRRSTGNLRHTRKASLGIHHREKARDC
jgi:hypothetical protein